MEERVEFHNSAGMLKRNLAFLNNSQANRWKKNIENWNLGKMLFFFVVVI